MARIVGILCTYNEEANISASLGSLIGWCDEVVVVDQHSTDRTREIAAEMGARVELHERVGLPEPARDWARSNVDADWVLFLDADEMIPATLGAYLRRVLTVDAAWDIVAVPRVNIELGRWLRRSGNWPSRMLRVSRPQALDITTRIHRGMVPRSGMRIGVVPADPRLAIWHFHHPDVETMVAKWNKYTTIEAEQLGALRSRPPGLRRLVRAPLTWFGRSYLRDRGYLDGRAGLVVAVTRAYYRFLVVAKQWDRAGAAARTEGLDAVRARLAADHARPEAARRAADGLPDPTPGTPTRAALRRQRRRDRSAQDGRPSGPRRPRPTRAPGGRPKAAVPTAARPPARTAGPAGPSAGAVPAIPGPFDRLPAAPVCPPGWRLGPPDFVILGAQKSGTTWWFRLIETHPDVVQPAEQRPEIHFFDRLTDRWPTADEYAEYQRYFPRPEGRLAGEKTPEYLDSPWVMPMLAQAAPEARVLILVRDPIARYLSGRFHSERALLRSGIDLATRSLSDRRRVVAEAIDKGRYATQLERVLEHFPRERTLVLQYERCVDQPRAQLAQTFAFLGLEPHAPTDEEIARPRNPSNGQPITISPEHRAVLRDVYRPEVRHLKELVPDLDLSLWPDFADPGS